MTNPVCGEEAVARAIRRKVSLAIKPMAGFHSYEIAHAAIQAYTAALLEAGYVIVREGVIEGEREARYKCEAALRQKDEGMGVLFGRLRSAGIDCSDLIS